MKIASRPVAALADCRAGGVRACVIAVNAKSPATMQTVHGDVLRKSLGYRHRKVASTTASQEPLPRTRRGQATKFDSVGMQHWPKQINQNAKTRRLRSCRFPGATQRQVPAAEGAAWRDLRSVRAQPDFAELDHELFRNL